MPPDWLTLSDEVRAALAEGRPVVALESTLIAHGLPWPVNVEAARESEAAVRANGAIPATIAVLHGSPTVGLADSQIEELAQSSSVKKASRRDLAAAAALKFTAATTVSATMAVAHAAGIRVFATGGIGGAHRSESGIRNAERGIDDAIAIHNPHSGDPFDISADLIELSRTPVLVVCAGAKSILHLPRTLEILETLGVPVMGYRTSTFPAFYLREVKPPLPLPTRVKAAEDAAAIFAAHVRMGGGGAVLVQPCPDDVALPQSEFDDWLAEAARAAAAVNISGPGVTPFLLARIAELSGGRALRANRSLIVANARLAAEVASKL